jgi:hypothetical protein
MVEPNFVCRTCGQTHEGVPPSFAADFPGMYANMSESDAPFAVTYEAAGRLFRRDDAGVCEEAAMDGMRIVEVHGLADEVGALVKQNTEWWVFT